MSDAAKHSCISLIGMMGAGKTTVGELVAKELGWRYFDNDGEIERQSGKTVAQIFHEHGETAFRDWEAEAVEEAIHFDQPTVLSVGGGAVMRESTRNHLADSTFVVWLTAPIDVLIARVIGRHQERPLIETDPAESMRKLYEVREPIYAALADLRIDDSAGPLGAAREIIEATK